MLSLMMLIYVMILITLNAIFKTGPRATNVASRATWCPRAPCWWPWLKE